jgi:RNA polymerase sigma-70 factor (ECF subfamily)
MEQSLGVDTKRPLRFITEPALLEGVRCLDPEALAETHTRYYPAIFRFIAFKVGSHETAEDLTSEVFLRFLHAVRDHHAPQNTLCGWLYSVASHIVNDYYRKKYRNKQETALPETLESSVPQPVEQLINKQTFESLHLALSHLTGDQQDVIALRFGYDMSIKGVAQMLGKSEGSIKQLQARAVVSLSRLVTDGGIPSPTPKHRP